MKLCGRRRRRRRHHHHHHHESSSAGRKEQAKVSRDSKRGLRARATAAAAATTTACRRGHLTPPALVAHDFVLIRWHTLPVKIPPANSCQHWANLFLFVLLLSLSSFFGIGSVAECVPTETNPDAQGGATPAFAYACFYICQLFMEYTQ